MSTNLFCPMIHGGLQIHAKNASDNITFGHCCLRSDMMPYDSTMNIWQDTKLIPLREINDTNTWDSGCWACQGNELAGLPSFRTGMLEKFGIKKNLSGPQRLDLLFDLSCNLACRTCGPESSTLWQKQLRDNHLPVKQFTLKSKADEIIEILGTLDLSNLEQVVFCGGETLLGNSYWKVTEALLKLVPHAKERLTLCFQTNGTQPIDEKYYSLIEQFHLVRFQISLDATGDRFHYMRWPAEWQQVTANILEMRASLPVNVMFLIEEVIGVLNWYYHDELADWLKQNFSQNRLGDIIHHTTHPVIGSFSLSNVTQKYVNAMQGRPIVNLLPPNFVENKVNIQNLINNIQKFDKIRNEDWTKTFPEVAEFYSDYLR